MGRRVLHQCCTEQTAHCLSPCNYTEPAEHTDSVMQREFSATNKLRTDKKVLILLRKAQHERWRSRHDSNMRPTV